MKDHPIARHHANKGVGRVGVQTVANHHPALRVRARGLLLADPRNEGAIVAHGLINIMERIGCAPNVTPGREHREHAGVIDRATGHARGPDVPRPPEGRRGARGADGAGNAAVETAPIIGMPRNLNAAG